MLKSSVMIINPIIIPLLAWGLIVKADFVLLIHSGDSEFIIIIVNFKLMLTGRGLSENENFYTFSMKANEREKHYSNNVLWLSLVRG